MKAWDLNSGAMKLDQAFQMLHKTMLDVAEQWNDPASNAFRESYLTPLAPLVKTALEAIERLEEVLVQAEHECEESR